MNKIRQEELNKLINGLYDFYNDCNISPKCSEDLKKFWIIDKDESKKLIDVMNLLADCGGILDKKNIPYATIN